MAIADFERYLNVRSASQASFSPDGERLSFLTDITGVPEVWSVPVDLDSSRPYWPAQLTFRGERVSIARYSPADARLLVSGDTGSNERHQLFLLSDDGSSFTPLTDEPEVIHDFGGWSPDGKRVAYASNSRDSRYFDVYERPIDGGEPRLLLQHDGANHPIRYSPDGRFLLIARVESNTRNQLFLLEIASGDVRPLTPQIDEGHAVHESPFWSADRRSLYLLSDRGRQYLSLARLDLETTELTYLQDISWDAE